MNFSVNDQTLSDTSDVDICDTSANVSQRKLKINTTSTPQATYKPRVNFHSIESLAMSSLNTSSPISSLSLFSCTQGHDDTGYQSLNTSIDKENLPRLSSNERKARRKLSDWQIWHLRQAYAINRYPTPHDQEQLAAQLLLPLSSVRIWFQNHRARGGRK